MTNLLLSLVLSAGQGYPCESASVERPGMRLNSPDWAFVPARVERACDESTDFEVTAMVLGIDPWQPTAEDEPKILVDLGLTE